MEQSYSAPMIEPEERFDGEEVAPQGFFAQIQSALYYLKQNLGALIGICVMGFVSILLLGIVFGLSAMLPVAVAVVVTLLAVLFAVVVFVILVGAMLYIVVERERRVPLKEALSWGRRHILPFGLVGFYVQVVNSGIALILMAIVGLITYFALWGGNPEHVGELLSGSVDSVAVGTDIVLPLVLLATALIATAVLGLYLSFATLVYIREGHKGFSALTRSVDLVRGSFWYVFSRIFFVNVLVNILFFVLSFLSSTLTEVSMLIDVLSMVLSFVFSFFLLFFIAILMDVLITRRPTYNPEQYTTLRQGGITIAILTPVLLGVIFWSVVQLILMNSSSIERLFTAGSKAVEVGQYEQYVDERITMIDVWFALDLYGIINRTYPDRLDASELGLSSIPEGLNYQALNDGTEYTLCRYTVSGVRECVASGDEKYPYED